MNFNKIWLMLPFLMLTLGLMSYAQAACTVTVAPSSGASILTGTVVINVTTTACTLGVNASNASLYYNGAGGSSVLIGINGTPYNASAAGLTNVFGFTWNSANVQDANGSFTFTGYGYQWFGNGLNSTDYNGTGTLSAEVDNTAPTVTLTNTADSTINEISPTLSATVANQRTCSFLYSTNGGQTFSITRTGTTSVGGTTCTYTALTGTDADSAYYIKARAYDGVNTTDTATTLLNFAFSADSNSRNSAGAAQAAANAAVADCQAKGTCLTQQQAQTKNNNSVIAFVILGVVAFILIQKKGKK